MTAKQNTKSRTAGRIGSGDLLASVQQLLELKTRIRHKMRCEYPVGSRVIFWRSSNQRKESFGTVVSHSMSHGPQLRVRYDNSDHVVGLHVGHTKFHSMANDQEEQQPK